MIVDHGRQQVICRGNRVKVAGKVKVQLLHGNQLRIAAAGCAALDAEARSQGRLSECQHDLLAEAVERICHTDADRGLSFSGRCRIDCRHQNQSAVLPVLNALQVILGQLGFVAAVLLILLFRNSQLCRDLTNGQKLSAVCNFNIRSHFVSSCKTVSNLPFPAGNRFRAGI